MNEARAKRPRIAVIRTSSIGDVVLASACLDLATKMGIDVVWLGRDPALSLLKAAWPDVRFIDMPRSISKFNLADFFTNLGPVDAVVDLQTNLRSHGLLRFFKKRGVRCVSARKYQRRRVLLILMARFRQRIHPTQTNLVSEKFRQFKVMLDAFVKAAIYCGINPEDIADNIGQTKPNLGLIAKKPITGSWGHDLKFGNWIAIAPGASYSTKQAPIALWQESLATFLNSNPDHAAYGLLIAGSDSDRKSTVELLDQIDWPGPALNLAGKLSLVETAQALSKVKVLLTNDSGLLHIAESVGTPVIAVFGPTTENFGFPPWHPNSRVFSSPIGCRPCSKHGQHPCRYGDKLCFESINTQAVGRATASICSEVGDGKGL